LLINESEAVGFEIASWRCRNTDDIGIARLLPVFANPTPTQVPARRRFVFALLPLSMSLV